MRGQRQILDIPWWAPVSMQRCFSDLVCQPLAMSFAIFACLFLLQMLQDTSLFGRIARLDPGVPGQDAVRLMVDTYEGRKPIDSWRRPPGHCCSTVPRRMTPLYAIYADCNLGHRSVPKVHSDCTMTTMIGILGLGLASQGSPQSWS